MSHDGMSTRAWRKVRELVLQRDGYLCQVRLPGVCTTDAPLVGGHVHHIAGRRTGLDPAYLVAACRSCNLSIGEPGRADPPPRPRTVW
jgi:5-methylcytosine-specific restriction endonuclease McrA